MAFFLWGLAGCAPFGGAGGSREQTLAWAQQRGFQELEVLPEVFRLLVLSRTNPPGDLLTIYIEGDGAPWISPWHPPRDPTPLQAVALTMAAADTTSMVAYLGRPCQYLSPDALAACNPGWWTQQRFDTRVVNAYAAVLDQLKTASGASRVRLVGYSGGGVIATLLAMQRQDVDRLVTVAAPLALNDWARGHQLTPFARANDPLTTEGIIPSAVHWVGQNDQVVPPRVLAHFTQQRGGQMVIMPGYDHACCWARDWNRLIHWRDAK